MLSHAALLLALISASDSLTVPGVSRALAVHRAATLSQVRYDLRLDVTDSAAARGQVGIDLKRTGQAGDLILDFRGPTVGAVTVNARRVTDSVWRNGHLVVASRHLRAGDNRVDIEFTTPIAAAGASIIKYRDLNDGATYLYTLLVPADANLLFPTFDQPDLKARFRWRIVAPPAWQVLTNGTLERKVPVAGAVEWQFQPTQPISTYLAAFAAGPWSIVEHKGKPSMRLFVRKSRAHEVDADSILNENAAAYRWLEQFFGVPYPFDKIDLLLAPAFPFGGMEHVGAIFYNESTFIFREAPTPSQRHGRASTIYHEIAHQWFGDFVTMKWFDDLWLKEGFATYMGARVQEALHPEAGAWARFNLRTKPPAYAVDATSGTVSVWQELPNLDLAKSNYGPIVYNKAPAILRQLEFLVGDAGFRRGVTQFLQTHAYGNATWQQLLAAISRASGTSLERFGQQYMLRAGLPIFETDLRISSGRIDQLLVKQKPARPLTGVADDWWPARLRVRMGFSTRPDTVIDVFLTGASTVVPGAAGLPAPTYVWTNDGDFGYWLFLPDERSAEWLLANVGKLENDLLRAQAWAALWDLMRAQRLLPTRFAERVIAELPRERDEGIALLILGRSITALERYSTPQAAAPLIADMEILLAARADDSELAYGLRKAALDAYLGLAATPRGRAVLRDYLDGRRAFQNRPLAQASRWAALRRLIALDATGADSLYQLEIRRDTTSEKLRSAFTAGAAFPSALAKKDYWERYFNDAALNEEWVTGSLGAFNDPLHSQLSLPYLRPALERAVWLRDNRRIFFLPRWLEAFIEGQSSPEALAFVDRFLAESPQLPLDVRRKILQSRDELERTVRVRGQ